MVEAAIPWNLQFRSNSQGCPSFFSDHNRSDNPIIVSLAHKVNSDKDFWGDMLQFQIENQPQNPKNAAPKSCRLIDGLASRKLEHQLLVLTIYRV
jgi:hypothetical protein